MGAENQKAATPEQLQNLPTEQPLQESYKMTIQKLFPSLIPKGKRPLTSYPSISPGNQVSNYTGEGEKTTRSLTNLSKNGAIYPESCVGYIQVEHQGSAFLIQGSLAVTLAHNCLQSKTKPYNKIYFCIRRDFEVMRVNVISTRILQGYFQEEGLIISENFMDFVTLQIDKNLEHTQGYLGLAFDSQKIDPTSTLTLMGYGNAESPMIRRTETRFSPLGTKIFSFPMRLQNSMLGGPVLAQVNGEYFAVGMSLWSNSEGASKGMRFFKYIHDKLNESFSKKIGYLNLMYRWLSNESMERVIHEKYQLITDIILEGNRIGSAGVANLVRINWPELRHLNISNNNIEDAGFEILTTGNWPRLNKLLVGNNAITTVGMVYIKNSNWTELRNLSVQENKIRNLGVEAITQGPWQNLFNLNLYQTSINKEALKILVSVDYSIQSLDIGANRIREQGFKWLAQGNWPDLHTLNASEACIEDAAVGHLVGNNWSRLRVLDLSKNYITQVGLEALFKCHWPKMKDLSLRENKIALKASELSTANWKELQEVDIRWNNINEAQRQTLKEQLGKYFPKIFKIYT